MILLCKGIYAPVSPLSTRRVQCPRNAPRSGTHVYRNVSFVSMTHKHIYSLLGVQWRAEGGASGAPAPGIQGQGGIQRVKLQRLKCCNWMIFPIVSLLIHAA